MSLQALIAWLLLFSSLRARPAFALYLFFASISFGSLSLLPPGLTGGLSLTFPTAASAFLILRVGLSQGIPSLVTKAMFRWQALGCLTLFYVIGLFTAGAMPRLFKDATTLFTMRLGNGQFVPERLTPSVQNLTQSVYLGISVLTAGVIAAYAASPERRRTLFNALVTGGVFAVLTGVIDLVGSLSGYSHWLSGFRTASYAMLTEVYVYGNKRVVGFMPEASAYGAATVSFAALLLCLHMTDDHIKVRRSFFWVGAACVVMAALSTSSTAFICLAILAAAYPVVRLSRKDNLPSRISVTYIGLLVYLVVICALAYVALTPELLEPVTALVQRMVIKKVGSDSFEGRMGWNRAALQAFTDTYGLGVGLGSVRTSNFFINVLSSTGVFGTLAFLLFLIIVLTRSSLEVKERVYLRALKASLFVIFAALALSGATPDFGALPSVVFGLIATSALNDDTSRSRKRHDHTPFA